MLVADLVNTKENDVKDSGILMLGRIYQSGFWAVDTHVENLSQIEQI